VHLRQKVRTGHSQHRFEQTQNVDDPELPVPTRDSKTFVRQHTVPPSAEVDAAAGSQNSNPPVRSDVSARMSVEVRSANDADQTERGTTSARDLRG
jgi:hypothetical protein